MRYNSADVSYLVIISYQRPISAGDEIKRIRLSNIINMFVKTNTDLLSLFCNPPSGLSFRNAELLQKEKAPETHSVGESPCAKIP